MLALPRGEGRLVLWLPQEERRTLCKWLLQSLLQYLDILKKNRQTKIILKLFSKA